MSSRIRTTNTSFRPWLLAQILKVTQLLNGYATTFSMNLPCFQTSLRESVLCHKIQSLLELITVELLNQFRVILTAILSPKSSVTLRSICNFTRKRISWRWWAWQISAKPLSIRQSWSNLTSSVYSCATQREFSFWPIWTQLYCLN